MTFKLKDAREKAGYSIEEVSEILKIRKKYLTDLEEGNTEDIPGEIYIKGYTKIYHEFLGLKPPENPVIPVKDVDTEAARNHNITKKYILISSIFALLLVIFIYFSINSNDTSIKEPIKEPIIEEHDNHEATTD